MTSPATFPPSPQAARNGRANCASTWRSAVPVGLAVFVLAWPLDFLFEIRSTCNFYRDLQADDRDPAYHGDTVTARDFDRVLLRWRLDDGRYRVVYGDLRVETVSAERLVELEEGD